MNPVGTSESVLPRGELWSKINRKKTFPLNYTLMVFCLCQNIAYKQQITFNFSQEAATKRYFVKKNFSVLPKNTNIFLFKKNSSKCQAVVFLLKVCD